jgi:hypothetical protein
MNIPKGYRLLMQSPEDMTATKAKAEILRIFGKDKVRDAIVVSGHEAGHCWHHYKENIRDEIQGWSAYIPETPEWRDQYAHLNS